MTSWAYLDRELEAWAAGGRIATLWWRDDDAVADTPALQQLLAVAGRLPLSLAVIPAGAEPSLVRAVEARPAVSVLQHGFAHRNHAPRERKKIELGLDRPIGQVLDELREGLARLRQLFGDRALAVLVPPWNRIHAEVVANLARLGFSGISCYGPRPRDLDALITVNTHIDIIDWHGSRGFIGTESALGLLVGHLEARRRGTADPDEPSGLITHHLAHDEESWDFLRTLTAHLETRPAARWIGAPQAFTRGPRAGALA
jgi:hypothetical protein